MADGAAPSRIAALDLVRGFAVLGILTVNIAGFAGPIAATLSPHVPTIASRADEWLFAAVFVLFEGKMRALFTMLFGASMLLFIDHAEAQGRNGAALQARRLGWLAVFGYLHYALLWWGDILFLYALAGFCALALRRLEARELAVAGLLAFAMWHAAGALASAPLVAAEEAVRTGTATPVERAAIAERLAESRQRSAEELKLGRAGLGEQISARVTRQPMWPLTMAIFNMGETLPLMLLGMALFRAGFFTGAWPRRWLRRIVAAGLWLGFVPTLVVTIWMMRRHFPMEAMHAAAASWMAVPHLLMGAAYVTIAVVAAPHLLKTGMGRRLEAAGRMTLSNYLGTSLVMSALFSGWGLGWIGTVPETGQAVIVLGAWAIMLLWSPLWLSRFHIGPLEWIWRGLATPAKYFRLSSIAIASNLH